MSSSTNKQRDPSMGKEVLPSDRDSNFSLGGNIISVPNSTLPKALESGGGEVPLDEDFARAAVRLLSFKESQSIQLTVTFFLYVTGSYSGSYRAIFHKGNTDSQRTPTVFLSSSTNRLYVRCSTFTNTNDGFETNSEVSFNKWTHVAYVIRGRTLCVFIDGKAAGSHVCQSFVVDNNGPLTIGKSVSSPGFTGKLKALRFYNVALTPDEITRDIVSQGPIVINCSKSEMNQLGKDLMTIFNKSDSSDFKVIATGPSSTSDSDRAELYVHKVILAARSKLFEEYLQKDSNATEMALDNIDDIKVFEMLMKYLYNGSLEMSEMNPAQIMNMYTLAHKLKIRGLEEFGLDQVVSSLNSDLACALISVANDIGLKSLEDLCKKYIINHFQQVVSCDTFYQLPGQTMKKIFEEIAKKNKL